MPRGPGERLDFLCGLKKLSKTELEFMKFIWQHPEGIASEVIYEHFSQSRGTKSTILFNISEKGYLQNVQQGRHHIYTAKLSESEYEQALVQQQLNKLFGESSFERLIAAFCGKKKLSDNQVQKVRNLLRELENDMEDQ